MHWEIYAVIQGCIKGSSQWDQLKLIMMTINYLIIIVMGTIMDLTRGSNHDHVDNPYWSAFQIKVKQLQAPDH